MVTILNASTLEWVHNDHEEARVKSSNKLNTLLGGRRETPLSPTTLSRSFLALFRKYQYTYPVTEVQGVGSNLLWHQELWSWFSYFPEILLLITFLLIFPFLCFSYNRMEDIFRLFDLQLPQQSWVEPEDQGTRFPIQSIRRQRRHHRNRRPDHAPTVQTKPKRRRPTRTLVWSDSEILAIRYYVLRFINNIREKKKNFPPSYRRFFFFHFKILWARRLRPFIDFAFVFVFFYFSVLWIRCCNAWATLAPCLNTSYRTSTPTTSTLPRHRWTELLSKVLDFRYCEFDRDSFEFVLVFTGFFSLKNGFHFSQLSPSF